MGTPGRIVSRRTGVSSHGSRISPSASTTSLGATASSQGWKQQGSRGPGTAASAGPSPLQPLQLAHQAALADLRASLADPAGYAHDLYAALRRLDAEAVNVILVESVPATPEWRAVRDRLQRAAAPRDDDAT